MSRIGAGSEPDRPRVGDAVAPDRPRVGYAATPPWRRIVRGAGRGDAESRAGLSAAADRPRGTASPKRRYLLATVIALIRAPMSPATWCFCSPLAVSVVLPATLLPRVGMWAMALYPFRMIPYYFDYEEFHEMRDVELLEKHEKGERVIACMHPHGVFPFVSVCAFVVSLCEPTGMGTKFVDWPTAVASVIRLLPILKDVLGLFGIIEASQAVLKKRLSRRKGSCILYVRPRGVSL